jgi:hypothetical protein
MSVWSAPTSRSFRRCDLSQDSFVESVRSRKRGAWPPLTKAVTGHRTPKMPRAASKIQKE